MNDLIFLKIGGSLITDKDRESTVRVDLLDRLAEEIGEAILENPNLSLVIGHGSGSFGHFAAKKYNTRDGMPAENTKLDDAKYRNEYWAGFFAVYQQALKLNQIVMSAFHKAGVRAITMAPNAAINTRTRKIVQWNLDSLDHALKSHFVPVVYGDVIFDNEIGGTILSTEDQFGYLAKILRPQKILLAGLEAGVWQDFPKNQNLIKTINKQNFEQITDSIKSSASIDVTGGMDSKVRQMIELTESVPGLKIRIFSGVEPGNTKLALNGAEVGTLIG